MKALLKFIIIVFVACSFSACHENRFNTNQYLSLDDYSAMSAASYKLSKTKINAMLGMLCKADRDTFEFDRQTRRHYLGDGQLLWINRFGVTPQADTLLYYINKVGDIGFSTKRFRAAQIEADLQRLRTLQFDSLNEINTVVARLDYNLTKAFLCYYVGQRYGFIPPRKFFNAIDRDMDDSIHVKYRQLYDVPTETLNKNGYERLLGMICKDSVASLLKDAEPQSTFYKKLKAMIPTAEGMELNKILVNMERLRWRNNDSPELHDKYVVVNIPSYELIAVDKDEVLEMKIVCGSHKTKTPLLNSSIKRIDLNPKWVMPPSVVKNEIAPHAGDAEYFETRNYYITEKSTGNRVDPEEITYDDLRSGAYGVTQEGGEGNALGRIIFRFDNNFAIYLHDTSTKSTFGRINRSASHGCIRVEKPYDLAEFLLNDKDEKTLEKIKYSMAVRMRDNDDSAAQTAIDKKKILHTLSLDPQMPLFICYHTLYLMPDGTLRKYNDVYGYDNAMINTLNTFRQQK